LIQLNGYAIHSFQVCRRKYLLESKFKYLPWRPHTLLTACLRQAIVSLSNSSPITQVITSAINQFTANCKTPGLDLPYGTDTYSLAMDFCSCIRTILTYLSTTKLVPLSVKAPIPIPSRLNSSWSFLSVEDSQRTLHRYVFPDYINDATRLKEGHSWELFGDLVLSSQPMHLHMISTGRRDGAHQVTPWCHAYRSPAINQFRFQKKSGDSLNTSWKPFYFGREDDPATWVGKMIEDGITSTLVHTYTIPPPDPIHVENFHSHLSYELDQISSLDTKQFTDLPITRSACDSPYPCQHQGVCYSKTPLVEIETCGLYERMDKSKVKLGRPSIKI
jgi:hypothetical protein